MAIVASSMVVVVTSVASEPPLLFSTNKIGLCQYHFVQCFS
jgi:hypothetical protein